MKGPPPQPASRKRTWGRRLASATLILVLAAPLIYLLSRQGRATLPLLLWYLLWLGNLVLKSMPQGVFWILFVCAALIIASASFVGWRRRVWTRPAEEPDRAGRVYLMAHTIRRTEQGDYFKWRLARYLAELAAEAVAGSNRGAADEKLAQLERLATDLPPELMTYFELGLGRGLLEPLGFRARLGRLLHSDPRPSPLHLDPEVAVRFLEQQLEVPHDR